MSRLLLEGRLDADTANMLRKLASDATANAEATQRQIQGTKAEIAQLKLQPSGSEVQRQIREQAAAFLASDRHDVAERRRFNN